MSSLLSLEAETLDLLWAEGAIYNIGFSKGIQAWKSFLRPGGVLVVSDLTWLRGSDLPPEEIRQHWQSEYPDITTATEKIAILEREQARSSWDILYSLRAAG